VIVTGHVSMQTLNNSRNEENKHDIRRLEVKKQD